MANWDHKVAIKHLFTDDEDDASVQAAMKAIYNVLQKETCFARFYFLEFFKSNTLDIDEANELLDKLYDYADVNRIWIA